MIRFAIVTFSFCLRTSTVSGDAFSSDVVDGGSMVNLLQTALDVQHIDLNKSTHDAKAVNNAVSSKDADWVCNITQSYDCTTEDGVIDLTDANTVDFCRQACADIGRSGCCEFQTDYQRCMFVPSATIKTTDTWRFAAMCMKAYVREGSGKERCKEGFNLTEQQCQAAARLLDLDWRSTGRNESLPSGCSETLAGVYFNSHPNGSAQNNTRPLCKNPIVFRLGACSMDDEETLFRAGFGNQSFGNRTAQNDSSTVPDIMRTCGTSAWNIFDGIRKEIFLDCLDDKLKLSAPCANCYLDTATWGSENCKLACTGEWCAEVCLRCMEANQPKLDACTGIKPPEPTPC